MKLLFISVSLLLFSTAAPAQIKICEGGNVEPFGEEFCARHIAAEQKQRCNKLKAKQRSARAVSLDDNIKVLVDRHEREILGCTG
ncbi:Uncharacterised protein [Yersinia frederiksenii]|uniref:Uncharacterized protein n=2 Tax=Yersinia frederiksenii TaxID=29484 RepID=A0A380PRU6_YERFR|nr:hypothetical protein [Yersinia frederiksenii]ATM95112.1 hypothetical protein CRN75_06755 [Yersinia frederiksenii]KGA47071.1 hypothetical protein DJ58_2239 [Yersinia frederiksenii ATCC 33641]SUP76335.1 Uncharacterised protein [Yersinia frederiksenii]